MINPVSYAAPLLATLPAPQSGSAGLPVSAPAGDTVNFSVKALADAVVSAQLAGDFSPQA